MEHSIEQVRPGASAAALKWRCSISTGRISVIRSGWMDVMAPMMVEILLDLKTGESEAELRTLIQEIDVAD